jgi:ribonuclease E
MPNKMLIDAAHPEETRVVVLRGQRVEEFDFESATRKQLRGNIYLAKVTRVEPSLQAAFVDYGGNRHGFLAFSEIHPDYYQIPVADRQALIAEEERAHRAADAEAERRAGRQYGRSNRRREEIKSEPVDLEGEPAAMIAGSEQVAPAAQESVEPAARESTESAPEADLPVDQPAEALASEQPAEPPSAALATDVPIELGQLESSTAAEPLPTTGGHALSEPPATEAVDVSVAPEASEREAGEPVPTVNNVTEVDAQVGEVEDEVVESVGGADALEELPERMPRVRRQYKIQEVIKRRQVMLVQVVKEERGTKGAALTTYLSLAGRYSVLMPNTARGGGISRKITNAEDRRRLKDIAQELDVPEGMGVILRTAGASRTKTEVKRDFEYLLRLWETVRDLTLKSTAPKLVYEEGSLIKRSIRDLYNKEIDEILVAGEEAYKEAKEFMRMLMPSHAQNVKLYRDGLPIFTRYGIESQLDAMFTPVMQLRSGGYIVLNQAEALVAIDVNSGRATREHHIEDTALKTNLEAAEEIARQLRLRDLAGLIVIDFIDMDEKRNNRAVERRLKECLRHDRARIQVGHISHFGLLEMSRQRIRSSVLESSTEKCPHCGGTGHVRSVSSVALQLLRSLEEMLLKGAMHNLAVRTRSEIALYLLNHKRAHLRSLEERFRIAIMVNADETIAGQLSFVIERGEQVHSLEQAKALAAQPVAPAASDEKEEDYVENEESVDTDAVTPTEEPSSEDEEPEQGAQNRRRRRRRRGRRGAEGRDQSADDHAPQEHEADIAAAADASDEAPFEPEATAPTEATVSESADANDDGDRRRRRRGRRGGRRNRRDRDGFAQDRAAASEFSQEVGDHEPAPSRDGEPSPTEAPIVEPEFAAAPQSEAPPQEPHPTPDEAAPVSSEPMVSESPRRRSTVRERAPLALSDEPEAVSPSDHPPAPAAEPVISSSANESDDRPRRSGWWNRRVLGKG